MQAYDKVQLVVFDAALLKMRKPLTGSGFLLWERLGCPLCLAIQPAYARGGIYCLGLIELGVSGCKSVGKRRVFASLPNSSRSFSSRACREVFGEFVEGFAVDFSTRVPGGIFCLRYFIIFRHYAIFWLFNLVHELHKLRHRERQYFTRRCSVLEVTNALSIHTIACAVSVRPILPLLRRDIIYCISIAESVRQYSAYRTVTCFLSAVGDPCFPMIPTNRTNAFSTQLGVYVLYPRFNGAFKCFVYQYASRAVALFREAGAGNRARLTGFFIAVIYVDAIVSTVVIKLPELHPVEHHDIIEACYKKRERYDLVVDADAFADLCELSSDHLAGAVGILHEIVDVLQLRSASAVSDIGRHLCQEVLAERIQVMRCSRTRATAAFR